MIKTQLSHKQKVVRCYSKETRKGALPKRNIPIGKMRPGRTGEMGYSYKGKTFTYESYLRIQERGKTYTIVLNWRGKLITTQMFIASFKSHQNQK